MAPRGTRWLRAALVAAACGSLSFGVVFASACRSGTIGPATVSHNCPVTIAQYCSDHACVVNKRPGDMYVTNTYCDNPALASCVTAVSGCSPVSEDGAPASGPGYVQVELGCDGEWAWYAADSGSLVALINVFDGGCIAGSTFDALLACVGVGFTCGASVDASADAQAE